MKRIVITGAQGFMGRYLVGRLLQDESTHQILGLGRSPLQTEHFTHRVTSLGEPVLAPIPRTLRAPEAGRYRYERADICDLARLRSLFEEFQPNWVFHLASGLRDDAPLNLCRTNVEGATTVTQALIDAGCRPEIVVYGSTGAVYGQPERLPLDEEASTQPRDIYGATKLAAEQVTRLLTRNYDVPAVWARLFNLVGPGQDERHACASFTSRLAAMAAGEAPLELTVGQLEPTRDFIDVRDAASALLLLARRGIDGRAYNIASGRELSIGELLETCLRLAHLEGRVLIRNGYTRRFDVSRHFADITRLREFGFAPQFTLSQSLQDSLDYYTNVVRSWKESRC